MRRYGLGLRIVCLLLAAFAPLLVAASGSEATVIYELDNEFSGGAEPSGIPTATITSLDAGTVSITLEGNLALSEFIQEWYFNIDNGFGTLSIIDFTVDAGEVAEPTLVTSCSAEQPTCLKADGDGFFDLKFVFASSGADRFSDDEKITIVLFDSDLSLLETDFIKSSTGSDKGSFFMAAHIGGIGTTGQLSGWVGDDNGPQNGGGPPTEVQVPAPAGVLLLGVGLLGLAVVGRRRV